MSLALIGVSANMAGKEAGASSSMSTSASLIVITHAIWEHIARIMKEGITVRVEKAGLGTVVFAWTSTSAR